MLYSARARSSVASSPSRHLRARGHVLCHSLEPQPPALPRSQFGAQVGNDRKCLLLANRAVPGYLSDQVRCAPGAGLDMLDTWTHP